MKDYINNALKDYLEKRIKNLINARRAWNKYLKDTDDLSKKVSLNIKIHEINGAIKECEYLIEKIEQWQNRT